MATGMMASITTVKSGDPNTSETVIPANMLITFWYILRGNSDANGRDGVGNEENYLRPACHQGKKGDRSEHEKNFS